MESSPESLQPLEHGVAAGPASGTGSSQEGLQETRLAAGDGPGVWAAETSGGNGLGAAAARRSLPDSASPAGSPEVPGPCSSSAGLDLKDSGLESPAAAEAPLRGQYKVTASPETAVAGVGHELGTAGDAGARPDLAGTCQAELTAAGSEEPSSAGGLSSSCSDPSPPGESPSLDSLESFSNLHSFPSSCEFNSEEGAENRVPEEEEGAAVLPGAVPLCKEEEGEETAQVLAASKERFPGQSVYHIKWIQWKEENTPIITQNENGPCPLLAILNVLLLAWKVKLPPMMEIITAEQLMEYLGDYMLDAKPKEISEIQRLNYEQNMSDAMAILHKLQTGLDVNIDDIVKAVGNCSYNQLVEKIISCKQSDNSELVSEGFVAEQFLNNTATQLTYHGLCELTSTVQEGELCVFFRNNHFSTMTKYKGQLYLLVTDQGFLTEEKVVWESLHNVDGDGNFCDSEFHLRPPSDPETVYKGQQDQIDQDYLMALSLQQEQQSQEINWEQIPEGISDLELAKKLQEEEDRRASQYYQEQEQAAAAAAAASTQAQGQPAQASPSSGRQSGNSERKRKEPREKDKEKEKEKNSCVIL
ncbi:ubiquitin carboxyl-terminal hydrolase MINDY-2 isoform X6 [Homo sapiens]|uniref:ubiquitin carboxyl-terminal hydrolase MINDY-2 isoform X6 n=1 Tax=Homo sapiens TaxID=9606 RepID=UPI000D0C750C|nr:ubiquitin carboxyl-terminal hydrolase MINDY-2 isoform X6 [Homo sapiens]XP_054234210.1 ubiquitin carboxyl-terminal hydrolase MINDY-2 isoform X6 [Homo sapiens]|eukprot:XP_024305732.1 ubiquitin carboxyl-terminal hydrolase MINDY-2 isoform X5 [Homo sapiens]